MFTLPRFFKPTFFIITGLLIIAISSFGITFILIYNAHFNQKLNIPQQLFISNHYGQEIIIFPFYWRWNYVYQQLEKMYFYQFNYYDMNQLLFNHSFLFNIDWNIIKYIRKRTNIIKKNNNFTQSQLFEKLIKEKKIEPLFESIITWKIFKNQVPYLGFCGAQFYPQSLYFHDGISVISYLTVHDVQIKEEEEDIYLWIFVTNPYKYNDWTSKGYAKQSSLTSNLLQNIKYIICAFNFRYELNKETISILSEKIQNAAHFTDRYAVIKCKIPNKIYKYLLKMEKYKYIYTPFQVSLFDPYQLTLGQTLNNSNNISFITIPICSNYMINDKIKDIYSMYSMVNKVETKKYNLGACVIIHEIKGDYFAKYDKNQIIKKVHEWIEYSMNIVGVEHFYFYQHIDINDNKSNFFWNKIIKPYYKQYGNELITYIKWIKPFNIQFTFQISAINSCIRLFGNDNKYLYLVDIDEYFIPKNISKNNKTIYQIINEIDNNLPNKILAQFKLNCQIGVTCNNKRGCNNIMFTTFIERHQCVLNNINDINQTQKGDTTKLIINPDFVEYCFIHYVDTFRILDTSKNNDLKYKISYNDNKYLSQDFAIDISDYIMCNHMKINLDIFENKETINIKHSNIMDKTIDYFKNDILNNSIVYNKIHNIKNETVLPYMKLDSNSICSPWQTQSQNLQFK